jgi:hypothetical protein
VSDLKVCPTCGTEYPLSERFCPRDGTALRSASPTADLLGQIVAERFHIVKKLGEGGMGTVYLAEHVKMGRKCALKVMNPGMNTDPDAIARFNREAANASRLSHPNICGIYDFGETPDGLIYLAMEFIEGSSLTSLIEKAGHLPPSRAGSILHQTADALQVAHDAGIVHRDLKPDNIMVAKNRDGSDLVKVVDFGIAKASSSDAQKVTKTGLVVGTPEYMSPEQLAGDKLDGRSDIYSLGLVAFNCLTGGLPFASESAQEAMIMRLTDNPRTLAEVKPDSEWPEALQATITKALARSADDRYQSAAQFGRDFAAAISAMPMTQAIEAGTAVLQAAGGGRQAALPQTRVARPSSKTEAMQAPAAKVAGGRGQGAANADAGEKKGVSKGLIFGGGGVAVAAIGVVVAMQMGWIGGGNGATPPVSTPTQIDSGAAGTRSDTGSANQKAPDPRPADPRPANPNPANPPRNGSTTPQTTPGPTTPGATTKAPMDQLQEWFQELTKDGITPARALTVISDIQEMRPRLTGLALAESHFVEMVAYGVRDEASGICRAAREVKRLHTVTERLSAADLALQDCS